MKKAILKHGGRLVATLLVMMMVLSLFVISPNVGGSTNVIAAGSNKGLTSGDSMNQYRVIAYVTQWNWPGTYDPITDTAVADVDPHRVTHINYAFGHIVNAQGTNEYTNGSQNAEQFTGAVDVPDPGKLMSLVELKKQNPELKVLLSVGGWGMDGFCPIVHDAAKRKVFIESCIEICKRYGLDGIDMDYEYPGTSADSYDRLSCNHAENNGATKEPGGLEKGDGGADGDDYLVLMKEFRAHADFGWKYLLTIASGVGYDWNCSVPIAQYPDQLDFINIMCYDIYGEWRNHSEFNANLYGSGSLSPDTEEGGGQVLSYDLVVNRLHLRGYPKDIINVGIPIYGRERYYRTTTAKQPDTYTESYTQKSVVAAGLGDASWMTFDQVLTLYNSNSSTSSEDLKDIIFFEEIALDPSTNKSTVAVGKGGVVTQVGGYTREEVEEVELAFVSNTVKRVWNGTEGNPTGGPCASYASGDLTVKITKSPKANDVGKTVKRTYSATYDDIQDIICKTNWIKELGFGGGMYWEYSQDSNVGEGQLTKAVWEGLNGTSTTYQQPARNGSGAATLTIRQGDAMPVISNRYDKSLNSIADLFDDWDSRENMQGGLGTVKNPYATSADPWADQVLSNYGKMRFFQGKLYLSTSTAYRAGYYGVLPAIAPAYSIAENNMREWMKSRNSKYVGQAGSSTVWEVYADFTAETAIPRTEFQIPYYAPVDDALQITSSAPSASQVHVNDSIEYDVQVSGGSGSYSVTHQVWFNGVKFDNKDGYLKREKRKTGGPYPIPSEAGTAKENRQRDGAMAYDETNTLVQLTNEGEKRKQIVPSPATSSGSGLVSFEAEVPGVYYVFTQVTDNSTGRRAAQFSQEVEVLEAGAEITDLNASVKHDAGKGIDVNTKVSAEATVNGADAESAVITYVFELLKGNQVVDTKNAGTVNKADFTPTAEGSYKIKVTATTDGGKTVTATSPAFDVTQPLTIVKLSPTTALLATNTTFTCEAIGGVGSKTYSHYILKDGEIVAEVVSTSSATFDWQPRAAGQYKYRAYVEDATGLRLVEQVYITVS